MMASFTETTGPIHSVHAGAPFRARRSVRRKRWGTVFVGCRLGGRRLTAHPRPPSRSRRLRVIIGEPWQAEHLAPALTGMAEDFTSEAAATFIHAAILLGECRLFPSSLMALVQDNFDHVFLDSCSDQLRD
jgi:hypothetical protein